MTTPTTQREADERAKFEHWMTHEAKIIVGSTDPYPAGLERDYWRVWQACAAIDQSTQQAAPEAPAAQAPRGPSDLPDDWKTRMVKYGETEDVALRAEIDELRAALARAPLPAQAEVLPKTMTKEMRNAAMGAWAITPGFDLDAIYAALVGAAPVQAVDVARDAGPMTKAQIDEIVYRCRQNGNDTTYDIVNTAIRAALAHARQAATTASADNAEFLSTLQGAAKEATDEWIAGFVRQHFGVYAATTASADKDKEA